jgi:methionine synthase I (cobalamin-dependent)
MRPNASTMTHEELDEMEVLDAGDLPLLVSSATEVRGDVPSLRVLGGCCGTDSRHVAALWGVGPATL